MTFHPEQQSSGIPETQKKKKKSLESALVAGTFLFNTGCSFSGLTIGQETEKLSSAAAAGIKYDFAEQKTNDDIEHIKKTKEFQRINETIQKQGLSIDPSDLAAIFVRERIDGVWKPMIKLSAWKGGTYSVGIRDPIQKLKEYGVDTDEFAEAIIASTNLLEKMTGLTVIASLKPSDTFMTVQGVEVLGEAFTGGESTHDDHVGDVVDNGGKYIDILLKNTLKDIPGGFSGLVRESRKELLGLVIAHEELHQLAFPGHIPGDARSLMNAKIPLSTEEIEYQGKKQRRIIWPLGKPTLERDPASIICRGGIFPLFKEDIIKGRSEKLPH